MKKPIILKTLMWAVLVALASSCQQASTTEVQQTAEEVKEVVPEIKYDTSDPASMIKAVEQAVGGWNALWEQKDVEFTYNYVSGDKKDVSVERYVFDSEHSWAKYTYHEVNVLPGKEGDVIQAFDGKNGMISLAGEKVDNPEAVGGTVFLRKANYFWFTMNFKLSNEGTIYEYLGQETVNGKAYDKVKVSYNPEITGNPANDIYIVFINPETKLIDRFFFSLPAMNITEPVLLMDVTYSEINGLKLTTERKIYFPSEDGSYAAEPELVQTSTDIKFNNGFTSQDLSI